MIAFGEAPFWVTAGEQIAGRGRMGRGWSSPPGNLYASHAFRPSVDAARWPELALVAAVAVRRAIVAASGPDAIRLKWPNDLMLDGAKLAGLLLDASDGTVILGAGINVESHPGNAIYPATDLSAHGLELGSLFEVLYREVEASIAAWNEGGFAPFRSEWLAHAHGLGAFARVRTPHSVVEGIAETVDPGGRLVLRTNHGMKALTAGDWLPGPNGSEQHGEG